MRALTEGERRVVAHLADTAGWVVDDAALRATPLDDGGMGSLRFASDAESPRLGATLGEVAFPDADGVLVMAALTVDQNGDLFELDVWKADFSPLQRWPEASDLSSREAL